jgi:hemolysin activation/secretion protein
VNKFIFLTIILAATSLFAQKEEQNGIQGIFLTGKMEEVIPQGRSDIKGIQTKDLAIPGDQAALEELLKPYLGRPISKEIAIEIKQKIMQYYVSQKKPLIGVEIPQQKTTGKVIQIVVMQKKFGKPVYKGESWYSDEQMSKYLAIEPGQEIAEDALQNNLSWMNRNPFNYSTAKYIPSDDPRVVDLEVTTKTRRALRFYTRAENSGSEATGYDRFAAGFSWGNALWRGDLFTFEYCFSNEFSRYQSYMANYTCFLPWKHLAMLFGNYAKVKPVIPGGTSTVDAQSTQAYFHYTIPFKSLYTTFKHEMILGLEYKHTNSNIVLLSNGTVDTTITGPLIIKTINVTQAYANYSLYDVVDNQNISFSLDLYGAPAKILPHQSYADFNALRSNSTSRYFYAHATFADVYTIPDIMSFCFLLRGQVASGTLPPTELFILGGYNTVRGYHEAELATDNGVIANFEIRSRPLELWRRGKTRDQLTFLAFADYGLGNNWFIAENTGLATPPRTQYLFGVGPGLRYAIAPYLQLRADYGFKLKQLFTSNKAEQELRLGFGQFHLGLLVSY